MIWYTAYASSAAWGFGYTMTIVEKANEEVMRRLRAIIYDAGVN